LPGGGVRVLMQVGSPLAPGGAAAVEAHYVAVTERLREVVLEMWDALRE